ncbi:MAG: GNAT family N-acetyltransferase [Solirubrobacterales bacterium]|nr:GNAT family N-acetyltransferase [Solirubrobacterales bacterium]
MPADAFCSLTWPTRRRTRSTPKSATAASPGGRSTPSSPPDRARWPGAAARRSVTQPRLPGRNPRARRDRRGHRLSPHRLGAAGDHHRLLDAEDFQGRGTVTRAAARLIDHASDVWELERIEIRGAPVNRRSRAIPERLGFHQERVIPNAEQLPYRIVDHVVYVLLSDQWQRR